MLFKQYAILSAKIEFVNTCHEMKKFNFHYFPRDFDAGIFIENFMVSAIMNVLFWRFFLNFTNYPKIIIGNLYFPHVLIGGILMTVGIFILFSFLNKEAKLLASIISGAGFGLFIDEIGKYITQDNNYFYKPTVALIYVIFVVIFLSARAIERFFRPTEQEYAINALELAKQIIMHNLDSQEKQRALYLLKKSSLNIPIVKMLEKALLEIRAISLNKPNLIHKIRFFLKDTYLKLIHFKLFIRAVITIFIVGSVLNFANAVFNFENAQTFAEWGELIFCFISGLIVILGVQLLLYRRSRKLAYEMFKFAVLISIFLTQFFRFLHSQFAAISVLILSLIVFSVLQYLIYEEGLLSKRERKSANLGQI